MKVLVIFVFLLQTHPIYIQKKFLILMYCKKCSHLIRMQDFLASAFIFLWLDTPRANQLIQFFCLVMVRHAQLCLDQSDSKILETPITEK